MPEFEIVPRGQGYWIDAIADDGTRTPLERLDTKAKAVERVRVLEQRMKSSKPPSAAPSVRTP